VSDIKLFRVSVGKVDELAGSTDAIEKSVVALFVFSLLYIAPGDPAAVIAGRDDQRSGLHQVQTADLSGLGSDCVACDSLFRCRRPQEFLLLSIHS
jgi:hypothetical protein